MLLITYLLPGLCLDCVFFLLPTVSLYLIFLYRFALPREMINCLRTKALQYLVCDCETRPAPPDLCPTDPGSPTLASLWLLE